jgi:hypothetical protein
VEVSRFAPASWRKKSAEGQPLPKVLRTRGDGLL